MQRLLEDTDLETLSLGGNPDGSARKDHVSERCSAQQRTVAVLIERGKDEE